jgi:hypothetical protein
MIEIGFDRESGCVIGKVGRTSNGTGYTSDGKLQCTEIYALKSEATLRGLYIGCMRPLHMRFVPIRQSVDQHAGA